MARSNFPNQIGSTALLADNLELVDWTGRVIRDDKRGAVSSLEELALFAEHTGKCWISGKTKLRQMLH